MSCFSRGYLEQLGGDYVCVSFNALDDVDPADVKTVYWDGRHDNWQAGARDKPWPNVHYFRPDLLGVTKPPSPRVDGDGIHTDFREPSILIYEPQADGSMELVAVENLVFADAWHRAGHAKRPTFHGVPYDAMSDDPKTSADEAHMFAPHYDRHVWIYRDNPSGVFVPFNPNVTCAHHRGGLNHPGSHSAHGG